MKAMGRFQGSSYLTSNIPLIHAMDHGCDIYARVTSYLHQKGMRRSRFISLEIRLLFVAKSTGFSDLAPELMDLVHETPANLT